MMPGQNTQSVSPKPAAHIAMSRAERLESETSIDVSGVGLRRQDVEPAGDGGGVLPITMRELLTLAQHGVELRIAQCVAARDTGARDIALDCRELERQRRDRLCQPCQSFGFEALDVDLDECRDAVPLNQRIDGGQRHPQKLAPVLALPSRRIRRGGDEIGRSGGDGGIVDVEAQLDLAGFASDSGRFNRDIRIAAVEQPQRFHQRRLRLDRHDTRAPTTSFTLPFACSAEPSILSLSTHGQLLCHCWHHLPPIEPPVLTRSDNLRTPAIYSRRGGVRQGSLQRTQPPGCSATVSYT